MQIDDSDHAWFEDTSAMPVVLGHSSKTGTGDEANTRAAPDPSMEGAPSVCAPGMLGPRPRIRGAGSPMQRCSLTAQWGGRIARKASSAASFAH